MDSNDPCLYSLQNAQLLLQWTAALGAEQISAVDGELCMGVGGARSLDSLKTNDISLFGSAWHWVECGKMLTASRFGDRMLCMIAAKPLGTSELCARTDI